MNTCIIEKNNTSKDYIYGINVLEPETAIVPLYLKRMLFCNLCYYYYCIATHFGYATKR